ncbi:MAG: hypothetical protein IPJ58_13225 [Ardenticatenia bacterium]|nr:hypothetical protein [Ardenticatenia bacterium]
MTVRIQNRGLPMLLTLALTALAVSACRDAAEPAIPPTPQPAEALAQPSETAPAAAEEVAGSFFVSADAVDPMTVQLSLNRPNAPLLQNLAMGNFAFSSPKAVEAAGDKYGTADGSPIAVGAGPYKLGSWKAGEALILEANPDYWDKEGGPKSKTIELKVIKDGTTRFLALEKGEIDGMNQVNPEDIVKAEANQDLQVVMEPANNVGYLGFNQAIKPWENLNCRLAVAHAIDKQSIIEALYAGDAIAASQMMPPSLWGYNGSVTDYPYDTVKAAAYLKACQAESTLPAEVTFYVPPIQRFYYPKPKELGELIQANLAAVGINAKIESPDWKTVYIPDVNGGKVDIYLLGWGGDNGDPDNFLCQFFCGGTAQFNSDADGKPLAPNAAIDTLLRAAAAETDQAKRKTLYEDANLTIHDAVLAVPLVHRTPPLVFGADLTGYTASPLQTVLTRVVVPGSDRLVFGHPEDAAKLDPADVTDGESLLATWHIYEGLTRYKAGSTEVEPALATAWTVSDDGLTWTFTLREGVTFHDGEPFNADAVVWNFNRWFDPAHPQHFKDWLFDYWSTMFQGFKS